MEKVRIKQASVLFKSGIELDVLEVQSGHQCAACSYKWSEEASEVFDGLPELEVLWHLMSKCPSFTLPAMLQDDTISDYDLLGHNLLLQKVWQLRT